MRKLAIAVTAAILFIAPGAHISAQTQGKG